MGMGGMGMGGGFRSVPATGAPNAVLQPGQTRHLPTRVVDLGGPAPSGRPVVPAKDEDLQLGDIHELTGNLSVVQAVTRLAQEKAPETVSQLVMWNLIGGLDWRQVDRLSNRWANPAEVALARRFVAQLGTAATNEKGESGVVHVEVTASSEVSQGLATELAKLLGEAGVLGLNVRAGVPARPDGPALACRIAVGDAGEATVALAMSDPGRYRWIHAGKFTVPANAKQPLATDKHEPTAEVRAGLLADAIAEGMLARLERTSLVKGPMSHGKATYRVRIENVSPLVLNGLALSGAASTARDKSALSALAGFSLPPRKTLTLPVSSDLVERLDLMDGIKTVAADLSAL
jgi:hypothetical protein